MAIAQPLPRVELFEFTMWRIVVDMVPSAF